MALYSLFDENTMTKQNLVDALYLKNTGLNIDVNSVYYQYGINTSYTYEEVSSISFYTSEENDGIDINSGLLLSSGSAKPNNSNTYSGYSNSLYPVGEYELIDNDLEQTAKSAFEGSGNIKDATVLEFNFTISDLFIHGITFDLIFASEEYPEYSNSSFVDIAGVYLNGKNVALFNNDETQPLSVISKNLEVGNFQDNLNGQFPIEWDGISKKISIYSAVQPGINTLKIAVGDTGDERYDSGIYIANLQGTQLKGSGLYTTYQGSSENGVLTGSNNNELFELGDEGYTVYTGGGDNMVKGGNGNDTIMLNTPGNNQIDGGGGKNIVTYQVNFDDTYVKVMDNNTVKVGTNSDSLLNVSEIQFNDLTLSVNDLLIEDDIAKIYIAYFGRAADSDGMKYWVDQVKSEKTIGRNYSDSIFDVVSAYADSSEAETIYPGINSGNLSVSEMSIFINNIYQNLFNRDAEQDGLNYWVEEGMSLQTNGITVGTIVKTIIDGAQDQPGQLDRTFMQNKAQVSWDYAKQYELKNIDWDETLHYNQAKDILNNISSDYTTVNSAYNEILNIVNDSIFIA